MEPPPRTAHRARFGDRSLFPDLEPEIYLSHAAISPASLAVREAVTAVLEDYSRKGGTRSVGGWMAQRERLRATLAELVGGSAQDIGLVPNTTQGVIDIALCFPWQRGDRVVLFEGEFPANVTPWQRAAELFGLELVFVPLSPFERAHNEGLEALEAELARGARLVATSFVQFQTGLRMPVERMAERCHAHGVELFVDAIQGLGAVPLDAGAAGIDYLACGGHKWLMGLEGAGFLYVSPERVQSLRPHLAGWLGHEDAFAFLFRGSGHLRYDRPIRKEANIFEPGAQNVAGYAGLEASVDLIGGLGVEPIFEHVSAYLDALEPALVERGFSSLRAREAAGRSGILGVHPPSGVDVTELHAALGHRGVDCTTPDGVLRFAPHWPNDPAEVPRVLAAVDEALEELRGAR